MRFKVLTLFAIACLAAIIASCSGHDQMFDRYYSTGSILYQSRCQNCHGLNGEGLGELIPPLSDSVYLRKQSTQLPCFVKNGLKGNITIKGKTFNNAMPAQADLTPIELAEVLTYVTNSFGNKMGVVDAAEVQRNLGSCQ